MEAYCSYEISKLLKEKGFNEKCYGGYHLEFDDNDNSVLMFEKWITYPHNNDFEDEGFLCSAPTHQMALAWLRQKHNINIEIHFNRYGPNYKYEIIYKPEILDDIYSTGNYLYYEDTVEAALEDVLKHLI